MIDVLLVVVIGVVAWCVASEGAWGAGFTFVSVLMAGLLAMNFFEPIANYLQYTVAGSADWAARWDVISLVGLFALFTFLLRLMTDYLAPKFIPVHPLVHEGGRWGFGVLTGYVTMAVLLTALHTAPLPRKFIGFTPERNNLFGIAAPDRQWLGFTQYVSEKSLHRRSKGMPRGRIFDGPQLKIGTSSNQIWPSFPIRYASRRDALAKGGGSTAVLRDQTPSKSAKKRSGGRGKKAQGF
jgi:hypothetical protein